MQPISQVHVPDGGKERDASDGPRVQMEIAQLRSSVEVLKRELNSSLGGQDGHPSKSMPGIEVVQMRAQLDQLGKELRSEQETRVFGIAGLRVELTEITQEILQQVKASVEATKRLDHEMRAERSTSGMGQKGEASALGSLQDGISSLRAELAELRAQVDSGPTQAEMNSRMKQLRDEVTQMVRLSSAPSSPAVDMSSSGPEMVSLQNEFSMLRASLREAEVRFDDRLKDAVVSLTDRMRRDIESTRSALEATMQQTLMQRLMSSVNEAVASAESRLRESTDAAFETAEHSVAFCKELQEEQEEMGGRVSALRSELARVGSMASEASALAASATAVGERRAAERQDADMVSAASLRSEAEIETLKAKLGVCLESVGALRSEVDVRREEFEKLRSGGFKDVQAEVAAMSQRFAALQAEAGQVGAVAREAPVAASAAVEALSAHVDGELAALRSSVGTCAEGMARLQMDVESGVASLELVRTELYKELQDDRMANMGRFSALQEEAAQVDAKASGASATAAGAAEAAAEADQRAQQVSNDVQDTSARLQSSIESVKSALSTCIEEIRRVESEGKACLGEVDRVESGIFQDRAACAERFSAMQEEIAQVGAKASGAAAAVAEAAASAEQRGLQTAGELQALTTRLESDVGTLRTTVGTCMEGIGRLELEGHSCRAHVERIETNLTQEMRYAGETASERITAVQREAAQAGVAAKEAGAAGQRALEAIAVESARWKAELEPMASTLGTTADSVKQVCADVADLSTRLDSVHRDLSKDLGDHRAKISSMQAEASQAASAIAEAAAAAASASSVAAAMGDEMGPVKSTLGDCTDELGKLRQATSESAERLKNDMSQDLQVRLRSFADTMMAEISTCAKGTQELRSSWGDLRVHVDSVTNRVGQHDLQLQTLKSSYRDQGQPAGAPAPMDASAHQLRLDVNMMEQQMLHRHEELALNVNQAMDARLNEQNEHMASNLQELGELVFGELARTKECMDAEVDALRQEVVQEAMVRQSECAAIGESVLALVEDVDRIKGQPRGSGAPRTPDAAKGSGALRLSPVTEEELGYESSGSSRSGSGGTVQVAGPVYAGPCPQLGAPTGPYARHARPMG